MFETRAINFENCCCVVGGEVWLKFAVEGKNRCEIGEICILELIANVARMLLVAGRLDSCAFS